MDKKSDLKEKLAEQETTETAPAKETVKKDKAEFDPTALVTDRDEWKNKALLAHADMENLRKRLALDLEKNTKFANAGFAKDLLPVADCLATAIDLAQKEAETSKDNAFLKNMIKGIEMTQSQLDNVFKKHGIEKIDALGEHFDPNLHQVISQVEDPTKPAGTIVQEMQTGYLIGKDRVLREAIVIVTK